MALASLNPRNVAYNDSQMRVQARAPLPSVQAGSAKNTETKRILAVDYGRKKIGLALSDALHLTAQPFMTFARINREKDVVRLRDICRKNSVGLIIVGHPLHLSGKAGEMADEASRFASRLGKNLGIPVKLVDERLTSWEARETISGNVSRGADRPLDEVAAAILLRDYLGRQSEQEPASPASEGR
jgi:putative holliday junction resolvase